MRMGKDILGEFEHHVLLAAVRLEGDAYSASIVEELERRTGREVSPAAVYIALRRLEESGFASSELRTGDDGARERRYFLATPAGLALLRTSRDRYLSLWQGLGARLERGR
jgi:DNA-binding PadR family transcriptional regulator